MGVDLSFKYIYRKQNCIAGREPGLSLVGEEIAIVISQSVSKYHDTYLLYFGNYKSKCNFNNFNSMLRMLHNVSYNWFIIIFEPGKCR